MGLKLGDSGPAVTTLQNQLVALGFPLVVDGSFGSRTDDAVRGLQLVTGLVVDGEVGPLTSAALTSTAWPDANEALMFAALRRIERTDTITTHLATITITIDIKYPRVLPDAFAATDVNTALHGLAETPITMLSNDPPVPEGAFGPSDIHGEIEATLLAGSLFGARGVLSEYFSGAAHPNPLVITAICDLAADRVLSPSELFMRGSSWTARLRTLALTHFPDAFPDGVAARSANYQHLTVTPTGVLVTFDSGQIRPLVAGAVSFVAPWSALTTVIRPSIVARSIHGSAGGPGPHVS